MHSIHLTGKKFHHLIMAIKSSNLSEAVKKSINFLALSRNGFIEQSYFYCFLALDYMIDEILKKNGIKSSIPSGPWGRIEKYLRKCIQENDAENLQDYFPEIISKLPELRRFSFNRKAMAAIKALRVNTHGIWVDKPFEEGLKEAAKIRNSLFHSGNINSYDSMNYNLIRLQFLLERIILRAINSGLLTSGKNR